LKLRSLSATVAIPSVPLVCSCNDIHHAHENFKEILKIWLDLLATRKETFVISDAAF
jgi:hypothetical protein